MILKQLILILSIFILRGLISQVGFCLLNKPMITLPETHNAQIYNSDLSKISGFECLHKDRRCGAGGSVAYILSNTKWKRMTDLEIENIECIWTEIEIHKGKNFLLATHVQTTWFTKLSSQGFWQTPKQNIFQSQWNFNEDLPFGWC